MKTLEDRLYNMACLLAQELQEIRDDCVEASGDETDMAAVKALLEDFDTLSAEWLEQPGTPDLFERALDQALNEGKGVHWP